MFYTKGGKMNINNELKNLNLLDRFLFAEATEDPEFLEIVLEIILGKEVILKELPHTEKEQRKELWSKQIKLDVWSIDSNDNIYDTEVQKHNTHNLPRRTRFYHSVIDSKLLHSGNTQYNDLKDVYIIMIMPFDLFGQGLYKYTFEMTSEEVPGLKLNDGAKRIFLNTRGTDANGVSQELIDLLKYFENTTEFTASHSSSKKIHRLQEKVQSIKVKEDMGVKFMHKWEEDLMHEQEGFDKATLQIALKMKECGVVKEDIAKYTGLSIEEIEELP